MTDHLIRRIHQLDTTYHTFCSGHRIEFYSLNGVSVLKQYGIFCKLYTAYWLTQDQFRLSVFPVSLAGAASEWFTKECLGSITTWDNMVEKFILKFHHLSDHDEEEETEEDGNPNETDNIPKIFKIEGNLFDFETPLCVAFYEFNYLLKIDADLFTYDVQNLKTYDEYEQELKNATEKGTKEPWWYDELVNGKLKEQTLALKAKIEGSWGDATPRVMKSCKWLKDSFENFHEIDYNVLVKLQRMMVEDYEANNVGDTQENQGHEEQNGNPNPEPSNCKIRRFKMMKYSFDDNEDYITIKESKYLNHSKDSLDAYQEILRLIDEGWVVTTPDE
ncbi:hypothetical protein Tco_0037723 [Tanacetum coccineum]